MVTMIIRTVVLIPVALLLILVGCSDDSTKPSTDPRITKILAAPEQVTLLGQELSVGLGHSFTSPLKVTAALSSKQDAPPSHAWAVAAEVWALVRGEVFTTSDPNPVTYTEFERDSLAFRVTNYQQVTTVPFKEGTEVIMAVGVRDTFNEIVLVRSRAFNVIAPPVGARPNKNIQPPDQPVTPLAKQAKENK